jgi:Rft protein
MFHYETIRWIALFTLQGLLKFLLQEGDRIVLNLMSNSYNQGVYALGSAYGGLAARLLLQPMEENARLLFGKLATTRTTLTSTTTKPNDNPVDGTKSTTQPSPSLDPRLEVSFTVLMKSVLYIGFVFSCLATNYTGLLLTVLAGRTWSQHVEAVQVLSAFCIYTAFLAANGLSEAFVYSVTDTTHHVQQVSVAHLLTGLVFAVTAPLAIRQWGTVGLVLANGGCMLGRSLFAVHFAARYLAARHPPPAEQQQQQQRHPATIVLRRMLPHMLPTPTVGMAFGLAYLVTRASRNRMAEQLLLFAPPTNSDDELARRLYWWRLAAEHVAVGVTVGVGILTLAYTVERDFRQQIRTLWHGKQD